MKKFVCNVCGYVHEGDSAPEFCPICKAPAEKFTEQAGEMTWTAEHVVGVAQGVSVINCFASSVVISHRCSIRLLRSTILTIKRSRSCKTIS